MSRQSKADALIRRALALEADLARQLRTLDPDLLERFAATVLELGVIDSEQIAKIFELASSRTLTGAFVAFARDTSEKEGLPLALGGIQQEADGAIATLIKGLTAHAELAVRESVARAMREGWSVQKLAGEIKNDISLTAKQKGWVQNFERELRINPAKAMNRELRDRRFDPSLVRGSLSEAKIERMVERYRDKWIRHRSILIARQELIRASNAANAITWSDADARGQVPRWIRKFWWHSHDNVVRSSHVQIPIMNPNGVGVREAFVTPLGRLRYPCDPMGVAEDVIGCRCAVVFDTSNPERDL